MPRQRISAQQALLLLAQTQMHPFTQIDWECFLGCESDEPLMGQAVLRRDPDSAEEDVVLIVDGARLHVVYEDTQEDMFLLRDTV